MDISYKNITTWKDIRMLLLRKHKREKHSKNRLRAYT